MSLSSTERYRQVALLHATSINQGFLATLGVPFLALMYRAIDQADGSVLITEERDDRIMGFVSGAVGMGPVYRRMVRHPLRLMASLAPSLVRPRRLWRVLETIRYSRGTTKSADWPDAELLSIAVEPLMRGTGLAERLYRRLENHFVEQGKPAFRIIVGKALEPAHRYYRRMGAIPIGAIEVHAGETSIVYVHRLAERGGQGSSDSGKSENS